MTKHEIVTGVLIALVFWLVTPLLDTEKDWLYKAIGPTLGYLVLVMAVSLICAFYIGVIYYSGILGAAAEPETLPKRQAYDKLRANLEEGTTPARL